MSDKWKGPATIIGQDSQRVLVKHGSVYLRVHLCRLRLSKNQERHNGENIVEKKREEENVSSLSDLSPSFSVKIR